MPPRFDHEELSLRLSVADLLEVLPSGSLGFSHRGGYQRMWLGQAIHQWYQSTTQATSSDFESEVALDLELDHRGWKVHLRGRADGIRREADGSTVVEEIKSVRRDGALPPALRQVYVQQALLYAWMLEKGAGVEDIRAELVLIEMGTHELKRETLDYSRAKVEGAVRRSLNTLLAAHGKEAEKRRRLQEAGEKLAFPYTELRIGQTEIKEAVETALENRDHLLVEAPTGIGKTVAALFPALRYALRNGKRLFILTAKTLQQEMAVKVLDLLNSDGAFLAVQLRAKAKMCANREMICHEDYCSYASDYYVKLRRSRILDELQSSASSTLVPDRIYQRAVESELCPFEVGLDLNRRAQVTVCDYNYVFEPYVALAELSDDADLEDRILIIDEIHNLVDRGRSYYSPILSVADTKGAADHLRQSGDPLHLEILEEVERLGSLIEATAEDALPAGTDPAVAEWLLPEDQLWQARRALDSGFVSYLENQRETRRYSADDSFVDLYFSLLRFVDTSTLLSDRFVSLVERDAEGAHLKILCQDPSPFLGGVLDRVHSATGLSATLSPPEFYRELLGLSAERTAVTTLSSPFPRENRAVVIESGVSTTYKQREANYPEISRRLGAFAEAVPGNCLALFPSYQFLAQVAQRLDIQGKRVLVQRRADGDREREEILLALREALLGDLLLLAVAGGVFAEGVDYPGQMLKAVAVVGPCLPGVSPQQQILRRYFDEQFDRGFEYAYVVPGMTRVVQAAGRLLRSPEDRGVIALFDKRFLMGPYRRYLPPDWLAGDGPEGLVGDPAAVAESFFEFRIDASLDAMWGSSVEIDGAKIEAWCNTRAPLSSRPAPSRRGGLFLAIAGAEGVAPHRPCPVPPGLFAAVVSCPVVEVAPDD